MRVQHYFFVILLCACASVMQAAFTSGICWAQAADGASPAPAAQPIPSQSAQPAQPLAPAPSNPFIVQDVKVDVIADSAVAARAKAFKRAQQKGFDQLAKQVLTQDRLASYKRPGLSVISPMVLDFEVTNERLSDTRYLGTYLIRFSPQKVRRYFGALAPLDAAQKPAIAQDNPVSLENKDTDSASNSVATEQNEVVSVKQSNDEDNLSATKQVTSGSILVLPYFDQGRGVKLWQDNPWIASWSRLDPDPSARLQPVVPIGDLSDLQDIADRDPLTLDGASLEGMKKRYNANAIVIAILEQGAGGASIRLYDASGMKPGYLMTLSVPASSSSALPVQAGTLENQLDRAAQITRRELAKGIATSASAAKPVASAPSSLTIEYTAHLQNQAAQAAQMFRVVVGFKTLAEWQESRKTLARIKGVSGLRIASLSSASAILDAQYQGDMFAFQKGLENAGFMVDPSGTSVQGMRQTLTIRKSNSTLRFLR